jgi:uncharacterized protein YndB with AHSA1/START domain
MPTSYESRIIAAPVADIWAAITDLEAASRWNGAWHRVEYLSWQREGVGATFRAYNEEGVGHNFRISEWAPQEFVAFEPLQDEPEERPYLITLQSQSFLLKPADDDHTDVTLFAAVQGHGLRGWITARFVWPSYQRQGLRRALDNLQDLFEPPLEEDEPEEHEAGAE